MPAGLDHRRPRYYAEAIVKAMVEAGKGNQKAAFEREIELVPDEFQGMVRAHVKSAVEKKRRA